jgi:nitrite reductase/ring-hydroxylating ferredoxin subunit
VVGQSTEFAEGVLVARTVAQTDVVLVRVDGELTCFRDQCSHQPVKLSEFGEIRAGRILICHAHGGGFDLGCRGQVVCGPPKADLEMFECHERDGQVAVII